MRIIVIYRGSLDQVLWETSKRGGHRLRRREPCVPALREFPAKSAAGVTGQCLGVVTEAEVSIEWRDPRMRHIARTLLSVLGATRPSAQCLRSRMRGRGIARGDAPEPPNHHRLVTVPGVARLPAALPPLGEVRTLGADRGGCAVARVQHGRVGEAVKDLRFEVIHEPLKIVL